MPYSDLDPRLSERDYRTLATNIVERLLAHHVKIADIADIAVALMPDGFWFTATLRGRQVTVRTGQGNFRYDDIAREMALLAREPTDRGLEVIEIQPPDRPALGRKGSDS